jgi:NADH dehydrogenase FAD-containing subunit
MSVPQAKVLLGRCRSIFDPSFDGSQIELAGAKTIPARTLIWTAGTMPNPLISTLPCAIERGRVKVTAELAVPDWPGVWALGDCALVPDLSTGKFCPPTAQHALRQGKIAAQNIMAYADGGEFQKFNFKTIGQLATIGDRAGVASVFGVDVSGESNPMLRRSRCSLRALCPRLVRSGRVPSASSASFAGRIP